MKFLVKNSGRMLVVSMKTFLLPPGLAGRGYREEGK